MSEELKVLSLVRGALANPGVQIEITLGHRVTGDPRESGTSHPWWEYDGAQTIVIRTPPYPQGGAA